jgi:hypothetical protein
LVTASAELIEETIKRLKEEIELAKEQEQARGVLKQISREVE